MKNMKNMMNLRENKVLQIVGKVIRVLLGIMLVAFILMVFLQRFSGNKISFFNLRMFTVVSGSMAPKYDVGDVLISKEVEPSKVKVGDTISYLGSVGDFNGKVITHQVTEIEIDEEGKYIFHTKGLANPIGDIYPVLEEQLYGVVVYKMILLSFVYKIVGTTYGLFFFVIIPLLYIIGSEFIGLLLDKEEKRRAG